MVNEFDVKNLTSFKIGGKIKQIFFPTSVSAFGDLLKQYPDAKVLGCMSNTLISSDGYDGTVICTAQMSNFTIKGTKITADCGVRGARLSQETAKLGLSGFEFMIGFPGSIGGNIFMNASANNQSISDYIVSVKFYEKGKTKFYKKDKMDFSYRHSIFQDKKGVILSAEFNLPEDTSYNVHKKMNECLLFRHTHQPMLNLPNCGSVFRNPENESAGRLLDFVDAKKMNVGEAIVWENHANFIVNTGDATSLDVLMLMDKMSTAVKEKYDIELLPEIRFLGNKNKNEDELCKKLKIELV